MASGTLILRPSADISVGHALNPAGSSNAYLLISEEESDYSSTYIYTGDTATSTFRLSGAGQAFKHRVTSIYIHGDEYVSGNGGTNYYHLDINGLLTGEIEQNPTSSKHTITQSVPEAVEIINSYVSINRCLPTINISVRSEASTGGEKAATSYVGLSQVYLEMSYEEVLGINVHKKVDGAWKEAQAAYQKRNGSWVEITEDEAKYILQNSFCKK